MEGDLETVQTMQGQEYRTLLTSPPHKEKDAKKLIKVVVEVCSSILNVEDAMLHAVQGCLAVQPENRANFANLSLQELEKTMRFWISDVQMKLANHPTRIAEAEHNLNNAHAERDRAENELGQTKVGFSKQSRQ